MTNEKEIVQTKIYNTNFHTAFFILFFTAIIIAFILKIMPIFLTYGLILRTLLDPIPWVIGLIFGLSTRNIKILIPLIIIIGIFMPFFYYPFDSDMINIVTSNSFFSAIFSTIVLSHVLAISFTTLLFNGFRLETENRINKRK